MTRTWNEVDADLKADRYTGIGFAGAYGRAGNYIFDGGEFEGRGYEMRSRRRTGSCEKPDHRCGGLSLPEGPPASCSRTWRPDAASRLARSPVSLRRCPGSLRLQGPPSRPSSLGRTTGVVVTSSSRARPRCQLASGSGGAPSSARISTRGRSCQQNQKGQAANSLASLLAPSE